MTRKHAWSSFPLAGVRPSRTYGSGGQVSPRQPAVVSPTPRQLRQALVAGARDPAECAPTHARACGGPMGGCGTAIRRLMARHGRLPVLGTRTTTTTGLRHPRVVSLLDMFEVDSRTAATVLEYCPGQDLEEVGRPGWQHCNGRCGSGRGETPAVAEHLASPVGIRYWGPARTRSTVLAATGPVVRKGGAADHSADCERAPVL